MFNQSLGKLEGCWNYTPPLSGCVSLRAVTHSSEECNLCVCLLTRALCSQPQEGHAPPHSQLQFLIKVNTVWKCSHTLAPCDGSCFEFPDWSKREFEWSLFCFYAHMMRWVSRFTWMTWRATCWRQRGSSQGAEGAQERMTTGQTKHMLASLKLCYPRIRRILSDSLLTCTHV